MEKGIFLGRLCPIHVGHEKVINIMIEYCGIKNCLIIIGSSNVPTSIRNFFSYVERRTFIKKIYKDIPIVGLPDYNNNDWFIALDDILISTGFSPYESNVTYFGGCEEDVNFFLDDKRKIKIINRFDGSTPKISGSEIRDCLIHNRSLTGLVNPKIIDIIKTVFKNKWEFFKNT